MPKPNLIRLASPLFAFALFGAGSLTAQPISDGAQVPDLSGLFFNATPAFSPPARGGLGPLPNHPDYPRGRTPGVAANAWVADYDNPMLTPRNAAEVRRLSELEISGEFLPSAFQLCKPLGVPLVLAHRENIQLLQEADAVTIIYQRDQWTRHVALNVGHSKNPEATWYGESVGHYEGDTLVVDTIGLNGKSRVDRYGSTGGKDLHVIERYHLTDQGQTLQVDFTVEAPSAFTVSWNATQYYQRGVSGWEEVICPENNRDVDTGLEYDGMPVASESDF